MNPQNLTKKQKQKKRLHLNVHTSFILHRGDNFFSTVFLFGLYKDTLEFFKII